MRSQEKNTAMKSCLNYLLVSLAVLFVLGIVLSVVIAVALPGIRQRQAEEKARFEQPFLDQMDAFTTQFRVMAGSGKLTGKILMIDPEERTIHEWFYSLGSRNTAQTPGEVQVLVWIDCREVEPFHYLGGNGWPQLVYLEACKVTVIDWPSKTIRASQEFSGQRPPDEIQIGSDGFPVPEDQQKLDAASVNRDEVMDWLFSQIER